MATFVYPPGHCGNQNTIRVIQYNSATCACSSDFYLLMLSMVISDDIEPLKALVT